MNSYSFQMRFFIGVSLTFSSVDRGIGFIIPKINESSLKPQTFISNHLNIEK